jgi:predicted lipoprotein
MGEEIRSRISREQNKLDKPYLCSAHPPHHTRVLGESSSLRESCRHWRMVETVSLFPSNARDLGFFFFFPLRRETSKKKIQRFLQRKREPRVNLTKLVSGQLNQFSWLCLSTVS